MRVPFDGTSALPRGPPLCLDAGQRDLRFFDGEHGRGGLKPIGSEDSGVCLGVSGVNQARLLRSPTCLCSFILSFV